MTIASILTTARLHLRPWSPDDLDMLATLGADPAVVRWVGDGNVWTRARARQSHERALAHWERHGFGWRVAQSRESGEVVGFIALNFAGESTEGLAPDQYEIGWWIAPSAWRRGYAGEGALAVRDEAFGRLGAPGIVARIRPANAASRAVAEGIGMHLAHELLDGLGMPVVIYAMDRPGGEQRGDGGAG